MKINNSISIVISNFIMFHNELNIRYVIEMNNSQKHLLIYLTFGIGEINMVFRVFSSFQTNRAVLH